MYRRIVSLISMCCLLVTQSAAVDHVHLGEEFDGHDLRAHFHTNPSPVSLEHVPCDHYHEACSDHHGEIHDKSESNWRTEPLTEAEHDEDAVFIGSADVLNPSRTEFGDDLAVWLWSFATTLFLAIDFSADFALKSTRSMYAPPLQGFACPIYLRQLTLLI